MRARCAEAKAWIGGRPNSLSTYGGYIADAAGVLAEAEDAVEGAGQEGLDFGGEVREHAPNSGAVGENGEDFVTSPAM